MAEATTDLLIEGRIATLRGTAGFGWVEAIAIRAGRVLAAGSRTEVAALVTAGTRQWQLPAALAVMPSFTDAHLHCAAAALGAGQPDLNGLDHAGVAAVISEAHLARVEGGDPDGWLLGHGWTFSDLGQHPEASLARRSRAGATGRTLVPRPPLTLAECPGHPDGRLRRDRRPSVRPHRARRRGTAHRVDVRGCGGPGRRLRPRTHDGRPVDWAVGAYARTLAELGVTSVHDPGPWPPSRSCRGGPVHYREMAAGGRLPLRVMASVREEQLDRAIEIGFRTGRTVEGDERGRYRDGWLKLFSDGAAGQPHRGPAGTL